MAAKTHRLAIVVLAVACVVWGCGPEEQDPASSWEPQGGKADSAFATKSDYFSPANFYFVRLKGWDKNKMTPEALTDYVSVWQAEALIFASDPYSSKHCPDGEVREEDLVHKTVHFALRTSGNFTKNVPKSSYKIKFTEKESRLFGMEALNFKAMWNDVSQMREALAWRLFGWSGVHASRMVYSKLCIKDRYYGLFAQIEQVDGSFLEDHFGKNDDGNLYKAYWDDLGPADLAYRVDSQGDDSGRQYFRSGDIEKRTYQLKTNDGSDDDPALQTYDDLATFIRTIHGIEIPGGVEKYNTDPYRLSVENIFDVYTFLRWASLNMLLGAWDNYYKTPANYYLYNSGKKGGAKKFMEHPYFHWIPWDYDNSLGIDFFGKEWHYGDIVDWEGNSGGSDLPLIRLLLKNEKFLAYYLDHMEYLLDNFFNEEWVLDQIGAEGDSGLWDQVRTAAFLESDTPTGAPHTGRQFTNDQVYWNGYQHHQLSNGPQFILGIKHYVRMRHDNARQQLARWREKIPRGSSGAAFPASPGALPRLPD